MAMTNNYGMHYRQKNRARAARAAGHPIDKIAKAMKVDAKILRAFFRTEDNPKGAVIEEAPASSGDEFGPLPGSSEWDQLTPSEKGTITKRRNAA